MIDIAFKGNKEDLLQTLDISTCQACEGTGEVTLLAFEGVSVSWDEEQLDCPDCPGNGMCNYK